MPRKKDTITLSIPPGTKEQLEALARRLKIFWGKEPSVSGLIVAIAQQQLAVGEPFTLNSNQVNALQQAIKALQDGGHIGEAQIVLALLLNQGKLETPLRQSLMKQLSQPTEGWRIQIEDFMARKQPFCLLYRNSQNQELEFTVRYAEIPFYEKRFYLQVWCEETKDVADENPDLPELWHNRCLRFDNIQSVLPINGEWRGELDSIKVYLQFRGWLAKAYEVKEEDLENQLRGEVRYVVRRVVNPFWLIREVSRYWEDCIIVAPDSIRDRVKQKLKSLCQNYNIEIRD
ncbi:MAG TPA: transcriptional regulator [Cyanobacteria bacterium UBA11149]|nr:transcriptional regulator [Cyanobacteria bacterium UBA11367]HBE56856.1 transcriptional regulator [Cyanobacteria bacterium UBA11366]HBR74943.1 transcriptional regulator [Cyanobacteria bacterium UBA11159]HBS69934.1 transcriptional regulator [Cyanobacteria bacterium UBA11153]HBW87793.1 transcriptional regulator [Cyanobacteria bacterium UBA11149]HCA97632.1 transcriptional regulator [Cyanobacteria bacterium UBA9226]